MNFVLLLTVCVTFLLLILVQYAHKSVDRYILNCSSVIETTTTADIDEQRMIDFYQSQAIGRRAHLRNYVDGTLGNLYNILVPEVVCPILMRVGRVLDGGKWVCNPFRLAQTDCIVYSIGANDEVSFEMDIYRLSNSRCKIFTFNDGQQNLQTVQNLKKINANFVPINVSTNDAHRGPTMTRTLISTMRQYEHSSRQIEIIKMELDDGAEYAIIPNLIQDSLCCQVLVEVHGNVGRTTHEEVELLKVFRKNGYYLFSYEINGFNLSICDFSFIHKSCLQKYGIEIVLGTIFL